MKASLVAVPLLLAPLLAGCLAGQTNDAPQPPATVSPRDQILAVLRGAVTPNFSPVLAVTNWETFLTQNPKRDYLLPSNTAASLYLQNQLNQAGYKAEVRSYPYTVSGTPLPSEVHVVKGSLEGTDPTRRMAVIAHYDTAQSTIQGAFDDGAGTIVALEICKLLAQAKGRLTHSIDCLLFDAEEEGLVGSTAYVNDYRSKPDRGYVYDLAFGYDMTGINWPGHAWKLYAWIGTATDPLASLNGPFNGFLEVPLHDYFEGVIPGARTGIEIMTAYNRSSDEVSFMRVGIPVVRFSGGEAVSDYPAYHKPTDTVQYVYDFVGGRANLEKGFDAVIRSSYYTIAAFDAFNPKDLPT